MGSLHNPTAGFGSGRRLDFYGFLPPLPDMWLVAPFQGRLHAGFALVSGIGAQVLLHLGRFGAFHHDRVERGGEELRVMRVGARDDE